jgi:hypothetical protein
MSADVVAGSPFLTPLERGEASGPPVAGAESAGAIRAAFAALAQAVAAAGADGEPAVRVE